MRARLAAIASQIAALPMDAPPSEATKTATRRAAAALEQIRDELAQGDTHALIDAMRACLAAAAAGHTLYVHAVPYVTAAAELLASDAAAERTALDGARFEIESLLPGPDVRVSSLRRAKPETK